MNVPSKDDLSNRVAELARDAEKHLGEDVAVIHADAARDGALGNSRLSLAYVKALDNVWRKTMDDMTMTC